MVDLRKAHIPHLALPCYEIGATHFRPESSPRSLDDQFSSHRRMHQAGVGEGAALRRRTVTVNDSPESMLGVLTSRPLIEKQCRTRLGSSLRGDDLCYLRNRF